MSAGKRGVVRGAVVVDVVGAQHRAGEFLQQVVFFVGGAIGAENTDGLAALAIADFAQLAAGVRQGLLPTDFRKFTVGLAHERLGQAVGVVGEVERVAALDAQEVAVDAALVAVVAAENLRPAVDAAHPQGGLASVTAVGADSGNVIHFPGAGFVTVTARGQGADRAGVDAHAAFFAIQMIASVGGDDAGDSAVLHA